MSKAGGYFNTEHRGEDAAGYSFNDILGRISYARKIYTKDDCENDRQRMYWDKVEMPYLYIIAELFDEDGDHTNAKAAAAMIRHYRRNSLPLLIRYSIEGSTLEMDGKVIKRSIARKVAATIKPANKACFSGVLSDGPEAARTKGEGNVYAGGEGDVVEEESSSFGISKFESPDAHRLGASVDVEGDPEVYGFYVDPQFVESARAVADMAKAITGGGMNAAPSGLTGGSALQREELGGTDEEKRKRLVVVCKVALRDYDPDLHGKDFRAYMKRQLPEASDEFIERFEELADEMDVTAKGKFLSAPIEKAEALEKAKAKWGGKGRKSGPAWKAKEGDEEYDPELPDWEQKTMGGPKQQSASGGIKRARQEEDFRSTMEGIAGEFPPTRELPPSEQEPMSLLQADPTHKRVFRQMSNYLATDIATGQSYLHTPTYTYGTKEEKGITVPARIHPLYAPSEEEFHKVLAENPHIQEIHDRAMKNWVLMHRLTRAGKLPPEVVAHAALFSAMSPNTPVYMQELAYAFAHDLATEHGYDPMTVQKDDPRWEKWAEEFKGNLRNKGERHGKLQTTQVLPHFMREYFDSEHSGIWRKPTRKELNEGKYKDPEQRVRSFVGLDEGKMAGIAAYPELHQYLTGLIQKHGLNGHAIASAVNEQKAAYENYKSRAAGAASRGKTTAPYTGEATVERFAPKTIRYLLGMMGIGSGVVPDTHFLRHTFGLYPGHRHESGGDPRIDDVKRNLLEAKHEPLLQAIDQWYREKHPAFKHTRERLQQQYGEDFGDQATFPAFWLHWLMIAPHEQSRGWQTSAKNQQTDHMVLWNAIHNILEKHHLPRDPNDESLVLRKGEEPNLPSLQQRTAGAMKDIEDRFGHGAASLAYYAFMVPALLGSSKTADLHKAEMLTRLLKGEHAEAAPAKPKLYMHRGAAISPGEVEFVAGPSAGKRMPLVYMGRGEEHHTVVGDDGTFMRLPPALTTFRISKKPSIVQAKTLVDSTRHGHPHLTVSDAQHDLIHGIDLANRASAGAKSGFTQARDTSGTTGWYKNAAGRMAYVKPAHLMNAEVNRISATDAPHFGTAHREAAFHRLADEVFGLGEHVPVTTAFSHPGTGELMSAQAQVVGGEHYTKRRPEHQDTLSFLGHTGQLDKLAMMDMILNSGDRHVGNFMLTPGAHPGVHLIDNGLTLAPFTGVRDAFLPDAPDYWRYGHQYNDGDEWYNEPTHPDAVAWAQKLDPKHLAERMQHLGVPESLIKESVRRMTALKNRVSRTRGLVSRGAAYYAPFLGKKMPDEQDFQDAGFLGSGEGT